MGPVLELSEQHEQSCNGPNAEIDNPHVFVFEIIFQEVTYEGVDVGELDDCTANADDRKLLLIVFKLFLLGSKFLHLLFNLLDFILPLVESLDSLHQGTARHFAFTSVASLLILIGVAAISVLDLVGLDVGDGRLGQLQSIGISSNSKVLRKDVLLRLIHS